MATKVQRKTPLGEFRWFKLDTPQAGLDNKEDLYYSVEMYLDTSQRDTIEFVEMIEEIAAELLGNDRRSTHALPIKEGDEEGLVRVRFKSKQLIRNDGTPAPGPIIVDSKKNPWPIGTAVGNGSKGVVAFKAIKWSSRTGSGISLIPTACMVVEHVPYEVENPLDMLDEQEGFVINESLAAL